MESGAILRTLGGFVALLRIVRDSGYADRLRAYKILVDGKTIGEIRDGETREFPISSGQHDLALKLDWCGSKTTQFAVVEGDALTFYAKSNLRGPRVLAALWRALFMWSSWIILTDRRQ
jgi:hypothetical protein